MTGRAVPHQCGTDTDSGVHSGSNSLPGVDAIFLASRFFIKESRMKDQRTPDTPTVDPERWEFIKKTRHWPVPPAS